MSLHNSGELGLEEQAFTRDHAPPLHRGDSVSSVEGLGIYTEAKCLTCS